MNTNKSTAVADRDAKPSISERVERAEAEVRRLRELLEQRRRAQ